MYINIQIALHIYTYLYSYRYFYYRGYIKPHKSLDIHVIKKVSWVPVSPHKRDGNDLELKITKQNEKPSSRKVHQRTSQRIKKIIIGFWR